MTKKREENISGGIAKECGEARTNRFTKVKNEKKVAGE